MPRIFFDKEKILKASDISHKKEIRKNFPKIFFDPEHFEAYEKIFSDVDIIDVHTHIGHDKDGHTLDEQNFVKKMRQAKINRAIVFPLNEPLRHNFTKSNERVFRFHKQYPDRIIPFFRLKPKSKWEKEYGRRIAQGFKGIKLHPRSQKFGIASHPAMRVYERAQDDGLPILIHTGFGIENVATDIKKVVKTFPKLKLILGHSAFVDLENTAKSVGKRENVLFDTSTVGIFDLLKLITTVDYRKIVFGSDVPYYDFDVALEILVDTAIICNKNPNHIRAILGGNLSKWFK